MLAAASALTSAKSQFSPLSLATCLLFTPIWLYRSIKAALKLDLLFGENAATILSTWPVCSCTEMILLTLSSILELFGKEFTF